MVIAIISILISLLLPGVQAVRQSARQLTCQNNLKQYGLALQAFHAANRSFPVGNVSNRWWGFQSRLLPFMDAQNIYKMINYNYPGDCFQQADAQPPELDPGNRVLAVDKCPDDPNAGGIWYAYQGFGRHGCTNYLGVMGTSSFANDGILLYGGSVTLSQITDGASHTIIMGERGIPDGLLFGWPYCGFGDGTGDSDNLCSTQLGLANGVPDGSHNLHFWSYHAGVAMFLWADGSGRSLDYDIDFKLFQCSRRGRGAKPSSCLDPRPRLCNLCGFEVEFEFVFWSVFVPPTYSHNSDSEVA